MAYTSGTITSVNGVVGGALTAEGGYAFTLQGSSGNTLVVETSLDGSSWFATQAVSTSPTGGAPNQPQTSFIADGEYAVQVSATGLWLRVRCSVYASGTITVVIYGDVAPGLPTDINAYLRSPLDGSGNVKVAQQGTVVTNTTIVGPLDANGNVKTTVAAPSGSGVQPASYTSVSAAGTTTIKASAGVFCGIVSNNSTLGGTVAILDGSTTVFTTALLTTLLASGQFIVPDGVQFSTNIKVVITSGIGTPSVTILWR